MKLRLFFKQTLKDFLGHWPLYLSFTLFFILAISLSLGLISFVSLYISDISTTVHQNRLVNARFSPQRYLFDEPELDPKYQTSFIQQERTSQPMFNFFLSVVNANKEEFNQRVSPHFRTEIEPIGKDLYKYFAFFSGNITPLSKSAFTKNPYLLTLKTLAPSPKTPTNELNIFIEWISNLFKRNFKTNNIQIAFIINEYLQQPENKQKFSFQLERNYTHHLRLEGSDEKLNAEVLATNTWMKDIYEGFYGDDIAETIGVGSEAKMPNSRLFYENDFNKIVYKSSVDFSSKEYEDYLKKDSDKYGMFFYTQQKTANKLNLKLGETYQVKMGDKEDAIIYNLLYAGTNINASNIFIRPNLLQFYLPVQTINKMSFELWKSIQSFPEDVYWYMSKTFNLNKFPLRFLDQTSIAGGQKEFSEWFQEKMMSKVSWDQNVELQTSTYWEKYETTKTLMTTYNIFIVLTFVIASLILILLFVIFFFISQQIILLQRKTLFFLKSLGVNNAELSLLTTLALVVPLSCGIILSAFLSFSIQDLIMSISYQHLNFYHGFWAGGFVFLGIFVALIAINVAAFFAINWSIIKSKLLSSQTMGVGKSISRLHMRLKILTRGLNGKARIGITFIFKNVYKNSISYLILTIAFTVILFAFQFSSSLPKSIKQYENWNAPYKSIIFNRSLPLFSMNQLPSERSHNPDYQPVRAYKVIDPSDIDSKKAIDLYELPLGKIMKIFQGGLKDRYIPKTVVNRFVEDMIKNPESQERLMEKIKEILQNIYRMSPEDAQEFVDGLNEMINRLIKMKKEQPWFDGINIMFGNIVGQNKAQSMQSGKQWGVYASNATDQTIGLGLNFMAFENDQDSHQHFHYDSSTEKDIVNGKYNEKVLKVNISKHYADYAHLKPGDEFPITLDGLPSIGISRWNSATRYLISNTLHLKVNKIIVEDGIQLSVYVAQASLFKYLSLITNTNRNSVAHQTLAEYYKQIYEKIRDHQPTGISNSYFSQNEIPMQMEYLTLPIFSEHDHAKPGGFIQDYFGNQTNNISRYMTSLMSNAFQFNIATKQLETLTRPFMGIIMIAIALSSVIAVIISLIITILALLENREIILLFKAMGYCKNDINMYLISGYFLSSLLAILTSILVSWIILTKVSEFMYANIGLAAPFVWSGEFVAIALASVIAFSCLVGVAIYFYTKQQSPKNAFAVL
ncbi:ABC transporter permease [Williamsoniiplasma lucivorax]|uniref:ABC transporter permease n=1 Tax=Williamsoniiplasma lucivorax TaxID=209274 RepID=A0A2S5RFH3_9MOLU|nr:ABC transporter permease [Williamsoniiplasma lucivorax]PPE06050.1 hypothetical protein ELUCI_v1c03410 [Williamsoniiplasma lucivorax]